MIENESKNLYLQIKARFKRGDRDYKEDFHCPLILSVMSTKGTMTAFCKEVFISDSLFYNWCMKYPLFNECYQIAKMISKANWEQEGIDGLTDEDFNFEHWRTTGAIRYGIGRNRVRMAIDPEANPYEQYKQLVGQAGSEEFTASEIKQLMESINVGRGAYETFKLQEMITAMSEDVKRMRLNHEHNSSPIASVTKTD